jgi:arabinofuranan 3-O-arabinosyltransferase
MFNSINSIKKNSQIPIDYRILLLFMFFLLLSSYAFIIYAFYSTIAGLYVKKGLVDLGGNPSGHDFIVFWSASKIAKSGNPSSIYSLPEFNATLQSVAGTHIGRWAWNYPPTFLLIIFPLSFLPYLLALIVWIIGSLSVFLRMIRLIFSHPIAPWLFLGFPSVAYNLCAGQNGFFTTLCLCGGLLLLDRSPFLAGFLLGILSYKPQLFALLPVALLSGRHWKALGGLTVGASGLALMSLFVFGSDLWLKFFENIPFAATHWQTREILIKMPTAFALAQLSGISIPFSISFQLIVTLISIGIVIWIWSKETPLALRSSILSLCIVLSSPYLFCYDLVIISLPFAWMGWIAYTGKDKKMLMILIMCWVGLYFSIFFTCGVKIIPIILGLLLAFIVYHTRGSQKAFLYRT